MSLSVEIIKKRKNTTAPWEVRAIQSVIKQNFLDGPSRPAVYTDVHCWTGYFQKAYGRGSLFLRHLFLQLLTGDKFNPIIPIRF